MKKVFLISCAFWLMLFIGANAQLLKGYGVKCALTSATLTIDYTGGPTLAPPQRRIGFNIGLYAEWLDLPLFSLITQVEYDQRGYLETYYVSRPLPAGFATKLASQRVDYLSVPILAKITFPAGGVQPYVLAGPRVDVKLDYKKTYLGDWPTPPYSEFKATDFGASIGAGLALPSFTMLPILFEFRYNFDFSSSYETNFSTYRNNSFDVWVCVQL